MSPLPNFDRTETQSPAMNAPLPHHMLGPLMPWPSASGMRFLADDDDDNDDDDSDSGTFTEDGDDGGQRGATPTATADRPADERIEWQQMLHSVLVGQVIQSEKKRFSVMRWEQSKPTREIWIAIRALFRGHTLQDERRFLEHSRGEMGEVVRMIRRFKVDDQQAAYDRVAGALRTVDRVENLFATRADLIRVCPEYASAECQARLDALNAWYTTTHSLNMQKSILEKWMGSLVPERAFVERMLKESVLQDTFDKRTLSALHSLLVKSKHTIVANHALFVDMNLPSFMSRLRELATFPTLLIQQALTLRLTHNDHISPPKTVVDTMVDDYRSLLTLACHVNQQYEELASPAPGWDLMGDAKFMDSAVLLDSVRLYFKMIAWRLTNEKGNTIRQCDIIEREWDYIRYTVCQSIDQVDVECSAQICALTNSLLADLMHDYAASFPAPQNPLGGDAALSETCHALWTKTRKLLQFSRFFLSQFENAVEYAIDPENTDAFIESLCGTGHFLLITDNFEEERIYLVASPSLVGRDAAIASIVQSSFLSDQGDSYVPAPDDYVVAFSLWQDIVWKGRAKRMATLAMPPSALKPRRARIISNYRVHSARSPFLHRLCTPTGPLITVDQEHKANVARINHELLAVKDTVLKLAQANIEFAVRGGGSVDAELVQESYSSASDLCMQAARFLDKSTRRGQLDSRLLQLAIRWLSFVTDACAPNDRRTFRWAVAALDFSQAITRGNNILLLRDDEFVRLQRHVARCITLLISHFDVLGTRWREHDAWTLQEHRRRRIMVRARGKRNSLTGGGQQHPQRIDDDDDNGNNNSSSSGAGASGAAESIRFLRNEWLRHIGILESTRNTREREKKLIGRVLEDQKPEDRSVLYLAPSACNISFRWQQGRFIGAGTFGSVYLAINLDTSCVMAVKEIRFPNSDTLSTLHKAIKEEMQVMDMLNHPNIVQYYGMEVHRDKVNIFMEYCENGSLGSLLQHGGGGIADERYIVDYARQLLKGLVYLHDNNVLHRDIKPDNILIDGQGHVKLSDFGAAKVLVAHGQQKTANRTAAGTKMNNNTLAGTPVYMAPEVITGGSDKGRKGSMDIWSLGCCIVQMVTGRRPWSTLENEWSVMYHVVMGQPPLPECSQLSALGMDFLEKCFTRSANKRPTAKELMDHPWITATLADADAGASLNDMDGLKSEAAGNARCPPPDCSPNGLARSITDDDDLLAPSTFSTA